MSSLDEMFRFLRFRTISAQSECTGELVECADWLVEKMTSIGLTAKRYDTAMHPVIVASSEQRKELPTVLIYGHYDVQPVDPIEQWLSDPFDPVIRDGRIYARGATDNKGQLWAHIVAVEELMRQTGGKLPVNVKFLLDGEEEIGSMSLYSFVQENRALLKCDVAVVSDTGMLAPDKPTFSYGLRGVMTAEIAVQGARADLHSGMFGGAVPNPATVLCQMLAACHDADNHVTIPGFYDDVMPLADWEREMWRDLPGMSAQELERLTGAQGVRTEAGYSPAECIYARPTFEINGIGGGYQGEGSKTIIPSHAFAKISCRLVHGQNSGKMLDLLQHYFTTTAPKDVRVTFTKDHGGNPYLCDPHSAYGVAAQVALTEAFGSEPVLLREGGSIPIIKEIATVLGVDVLLLGMCLPDAALHAPNENFRVDVLHRGIEMSKILLYKLGETKQ